MARPSTFSMAEDVIVQATMTLSAEDTNQKLVAAGYEERSLDAIYSRRNYLKRKPPSVPELLQRREALQHEREAADTALREVNQELQRLLRETSDEIEEALKE